MKGYGTTPGADELQGLIAQGLKNSEGKLLPHAIDAQSGDTFQFCLPSENPRHWATCDHATHGVIMLGTNSVAAETLELIFDRLKIIAAAIKACTLRSKAYAVAILPRTNSDNSARISGYEFGGKPEQFNAAIQAMVGAELDGVISFNDGKVYLPGGHVLTSGSGGVMNQSNGLWLSPTFVLNEGVSTGAHFLDTGVDTSKDTTRLWANTLAWVLVKHQGHLEQISL